MPVEVTVEGRKTRTDHLTLAQLRSLQERTGKRLADVNPWASAKDALALATVLLESAGQVADAAALPGLVGAWLSHVDDDLPDVFRDGIPTMGGCVFDDYIAVFGAPYLRTKHGIAPGWGWPPDVTRRQQKRDLDLLLESAKGRR